VTFWPDGKPSEKILRVLRGEVDLVDADRATQSACRKHFYDAAVEVLAMPKEQRRGYLDSVPKLVWPHVEAETIRVHRMLTKPQNKL